MLFKETMRYIILFLLISSSLQAEVITDGSLGERINLPGPNFQIDAQLGQQRGGNLFHSFQDFNLHSHESATFSGNNQVQNIISRVTGGHPSQLDGTIRAVPNANMYLLNPYGILFGPNARLDIQGSFYASTADYLRLGSAGKFNARQLSDSNLTISPVEAFGFLTSTPETLSIQASQLAVSEQVTLSLIGGDIKITSGQLFAPSGRLNLVSIAQAGEIQRSFNTESFTQQGTIDLSAQTNLNVSGAGGGKVLIRGGQLLVENATVQADTLGDQPGQGIDLQLTERIALDGKSTEVTSSTFGQGKAGNINLATPHLTVHQGKLSSSSFNTGQAGDILINTSQMTVHEGGTISSDSFSTGPAGNLMITAKHSVLVADKRLFLERETAAFLSQLSSVAIDQGQGGQVIIHTPQLILDGGAIVSHSHTRGNAGEIVIEADTVDLINGGIISATTLSQSLGTGGNITLHVKDTIHIRGIRQGFSISTTDTFKNLPSGIVAVTFGAGAAGNIQLTAKSLVLENEGTIGAATGGTGPAGNITIKVDDLRQTEGGFITNSSGGIAGERLFIGTGSSGTIKITAKNSIVASGQRINPSGIVSNTLASGQGGNIEIKTNTLHLTKGATCSASSLGTGNAGALHIQANTIYLTDEGNITTSAEKAIGGNIMVNIDSTDSLLYLRDAQITTSVGTGKGKGGDITIEQPIFVVLNKGLIKAQADEGQGGDIHITTQQLVTSTDSLVSASSRLGIDGHVKVEGLDENINDSLIALSVTTLDERVKLEPPCQTDGKTASHFYVNLDADFPPSTQDIQGSGQLASASKGKSSLASLNKAKE